MRNQPSACLADWAVFALLAAIALGPVVTLAHADFTYPDASRHAMDGVFLLDALTELPLDNPIGWAESYYLRSPALGIGRYPPLFAVMQVPFYAVLGVTAFAGRLAVAIIWLAGLVFFYESVRVILGRPGAAVAAATLAAGPASVRWGADVMLELPATAFLLVGAYWYVRFLAQGNRRLLVAAVIFVSLAGWVKQPAVLVLFAMALHYLWAKGLRKETLRTAVAPVLAGALLLAPLAVLSLVFGKANVAILAGLGRSYPFWSAGNWLYYFVRIPGLYVGWPCTILVSVGLVRALFTVRTPESGFFGLWAGVFYLFFSVVALKSERFGMFLTPALAFFAGLSVAGLRIRTVLKAAVTLAIFAGVAVTFLGGIALIPRVGAPLRVVAEKVLERRPQRVFYVGSRNGTFIFRIREIAGRQRPAVVRDSKVLYHDFIARELGRTEKAWTIDGLRELMSRISPDVVVVETGVGGDERPARAVISFLSYVATADFEPVDRILGDSGTGQPLVFDVYVYRGPRNPTGITIPMPGVGMQLELPGGD